MPNCVSAVNYVTTLSVGLAGVTRLCGLKGGASEPNGILKTIGCKESLQTASVIRSYLPLCRYARNPQGRWCDSIGFGTYAVGPIANTAITAKIVSRQFIIFPRESTWKKACFCRTTADGLYIRRMTDRVSTITIAWFAGDTFGTYYPGFARARRIGEHTAHEKSNRVMKITNRFYFSLYCRRRFTNADLCFSFFFLPPSPH